MIKLKQPVIVEGKYDKITLENVIDALIIPTNGFGIFKDREKCAMIRSLAKKNGVIIMTDSDSAGAVIRSYLKKIIGDSEIINVYVPQLKGKEKRKASGSKEGFLGVEGMTPQIIEEALKKSGVFCDKGKALKKITRADMFKYGLSGGKDSAEKRKSFLKYLSLPESLSSCAMLDVINNMFTAEELDEKIAHWRNSSDADR